MTPLLSNMSPEDVRVAMAEVAGYTNIRIINPKSYLFKNIQGQIPIVEGEAWTSTYFSIPDYLTSLDAVAPVEARLTELEYERFENALREITGIISGESIESFRLRLILSATALQRTKAILLATGKARL